MKTHQSENRKALRLQKSFATEAGPSFHQELIAAIHGAFEVTVDIIVREVETLVGQVTGDICEGLHRENESLKQKLQKAEAMLETLCAEEEKDNPANEVSVKIHRDPLRGGSADRAKVREASDLTGEEDRSGSEMTGCDSDTGLNSEGEQDGCEEVTEWISRENAVKVEARITEEQNLEARNAAPPRLANSESTSKHIFIKREEPEEISATSCGLDFTKAVDFNLQAMKWIPELPDQDLDAEMINSGLDQTLPPNLVAQLPSDHQSISDFSELIQQIDPTIRPQQSQQVYGVRVRPSQTISSPHVCKFCNQSFLLPSLLRRHSGQCSQRLHQRYPQQLVKNKGVRPQLYPLGCSPFRCTVCSREFNRLENLKTHLRIHTGERPYTCSVCSKCFRHSGALTRHFRIHTGEKPYVCGQCGKSFRNCGGLKFHQRSHST